MSIHIVKKEHQAVGEFNGGEIQENKPIGFPREGGELTPYSNLFPTVRTDKKIYL